MLSFLWYSKWDIDSMLTFVCSVVDHRWHWNMVSIKNWRMRCSQVCYCYSYPIFMSSVISYWTDPQHQRINLFYNQKQNVVNGEVIYASFLREIISKNQSNFLNHSTYRMIFLFDFLQCVWTRLLPRRHWWASLQFFPNFDDFLMTWFLSNFLDDFKFKAKRRNWIFDDGGF